MSQRAVERTLGKLLTDPKFREEFLRNPVAASVGIGVELSRQEIDALVRIPQGALASLCAKLDDRICRLHVHDQPPAQEQQR
jgi:hypothetical protein